MRSKRVHLSLLVAVLSALALSQSAAADRQPVRFNAADQAAARGAVLRKADFGGVAGWKGGLTKPDFKPSPCGGYEPKSTDLLVTGAAASEWEHTSGLAFMSETWVLRTPAMVKLDWRRAVEHRGYLECLVEKQFAGEAAMRLVSFEQTRFPKLAPLCRRYRLLVDYAGQGQTVRIMFDVILMGKGRTELTLASVAPYAARRAVEVAELRLARMLVGRATA